MTRPLASLCADLAAAEAKIPHLREGCAKAVVWAGEEAVQTPLSVVFLHGFSASCGELRPLPEDVARGLGANLFLTRLAGHGQDGPAMAEATLDAWRADVAEALEIGAALGERVVIIGCSTGCTLATDALAQRSAAPVAGCCFISPNFGLRNIAAQTLLDLPRSADWAPYLVGTERAFDVVNAAHAQFWTTRYPTKAVRPMAEAIRAVRQADLGAVAVPLLMAVNPRDQVINPKRAEQVCVRWGGPSEMIPLEQTPLDDPMGHIMAGDIFSPGQTAPLVGRIVAWARNL